jgi:hypothetical protein
MCQSAIKLYLICTAEKKWQEVVCVITNDKNGEILEADLQSIDIQDDAFSRNVSNI